MVRIRAITVLCRSQTRGESGILNPLGKAQVCFSLVKINPTQAPPLVVSSPRSFQVCHALLQTPPTPRSGQNVFLKLNIKKEHPDELEQCVYTAFFFARNTGPLAA
jgi:hypothetical protein